MGKFMRKAKITGDVPAVMDSSLGVRTRAKTLALQRLQSTTTTTTTTTTPNPNSSYLELRSRRLEKPITKIQQEVSTPKDNPSPRQSSAKSAGSNSVSIRCCEKKEDTILVENKEDETTECDCDLGVDVSFGENNLDFDARERSTRESTPCSLIRDSETIGTPGSSTRPTSLSSRRIRNTMPRNIPTAHELEEFFAHAEQQQQRLFIEKYNFDVVNDVPLEGRYEWVRLY